MPTKAQIREALLGTVQDMADVNPYFKGLFYGPSGGGKTVLALQVAQQVTPPDKLILYIDSLEHWVSVVNHPELKNRVRRIKYEGLSQIDEIREAIQEGFDFFADVGTVVFDELDSMQGEDLDLVAQNSKETDHGPDDVTWPDFNKNTVRVRRTMRAFLKQDLNVICVAHDGEGKDRRGVIVQRPDFTPKLAKVILEFMHLCGHMTAEIVKTSADKNEYVRWVQVHPTGNLITKCRIGGLPYKIESKDLIPSIVEWRKGERGTLDDVKYDSLLKNEVADTAAIEVED